MTKVIVSFQTIQSTRQKAVISPKFNELTPLAQAVIVRRFVRTFHDLSGLRFPTENMLLLFRRVNPATTDERLSPFGLETIQIEITRRVQCAVASALAASACEEIS